MQIGDAKTIEKVIEITKSFYSLPTGLTFLNCVNSLDQVGLWLFRFINKSYIGYLGV